MGFLPSPTVLSREVGDETVLVDLENEMYFSLNMTGTLVWSRLVSGSTLTEIIDETAERFGLTAETAQQDIAKLVDQLQNAGLLVSD